MARFKGHVKRKVKKKMLWFGFVDQNFKNSWTNVNKVTNFLMEIISISKIIFQFKSHKLVQKS